MSGLILILKTAFILAKAQRSQRKSRRYGNARYNLNGDSSFLVIFLIILGALGEKLLFQVNRYIGTCCIPKVVAIQPRRQLLTQSRNARNENKALTVIFSFTRLVRGCVYVTYRFYNVAPLRELLFIGSVSGLAGEQQKTRRRVVKQG